MQQLDEIHLVNTLFLLATEVEVSELPKTNSAIGIDVGLKDFAILSNGTTLF